MKPEQKGLHSKYIKQYIEMLEGQHLSTHSVIIAKGDDVLFENYWEPFGPDMPHRIYSMSKSLTSLAIGFLEQDGMICLDDPLSKYFPEEVQISKDPGVHRQTLRDMLKMSPARVPKHWIEREYVEDRVKCYFEDPQDRSMETDTFTGFLEGHREPGTIFEYDTTGTFLLGAIVERTTGKTLMDYLREKLFDPIGMSEDTICLTCPGGHAWCDSGMMISSRDMLKIGQFLLNKGKWNGRQLLNEDYIAAATSKQIDTNSWGIENWNTFGYGYQIWRTYQDSFMFWGMGCQVVICVPKKNLILVATGDNQGNEFGMRIVVKSFFDIIVNNTEDTEVPEEKGAYDELMNYVSTLKLAAAWGEKCSPVEEKINGVTYVMEDNPMGISRMKLVFTENGGMLYYTNAQGDKELPFGRCENAFCDFPEEGYSDMVGSVSEPGHKYHCAASAAWTMEDKLFLSVQILDKYFGRLNISLGFKEDSLSVHMVKSAEAFLDTYQGFARGYAKI